jgi:phage FluMu protein Com
MPIRFRCHHCEKLLGIARRKAGAQIHCPQCGVSLVVPAQDETDRTLEGLDDLLGPPPANGQSPHAAPMPAPEPAHSVLMTDERSVVPAPPRVSMRSAPRKPTPREDALFEANVDELLGLANREGALDLGDDRPVKRVAGMDAMSLEERSGKIVLTSQKATLLVIAAAALMVLAFVAGFLIGWKS